MNAPKVTYFNLLFVVGTLNTFGIVKQRFVMATVATQLYSWTCLFVSYQDRV